MKITFRGVCEVMAIVVTTTIAGQVAYETSLEGWLNLGKAIVAGMTLLGVIFLACRLQDKYLPKGTDNW